MLCSHIWLSVCSTEHWAHHRHLVACAVGAVDWYATAAVICWPYRFDAITLLPFVVCSLTAVFTAAVVYDYNPHS